MSPHDENFPGRTSVPGPQPRERLAESPPTQERPLPEERSSAESRREFRTFDRTGMPGAKRLNDPEMRGRLRRSQDNRARRKRRQRTLRWVVPSAIGLIFAVLIGLTIRNYHAQDDDDATTGTEAAPASPATLSESREALFAPPAVQVDPNHPERSREVESARDRYLLRTGAVERGGEISEQSKDALRDAGLAPSGDAKSGDQEEEISEDEKMRLLRKAAPYSRTVRAPQEKRDVSPKDLYIPEAKPAK